MPSGPMLSMTVWGIPLAHATWCPVGDSCVVANDRISPGLTSHGSSGLLVRDQPGAIAIEKWCMVSRYTGHRRTVVVVERAEDDVGGSVRICERGACRSTTIVRVAARTNTAIAPVRSSR